MRNPDRLSILYVAYPLLPLSSESAGGAEQMLLVLEREMAAAGHSTTVAACEGSRVSGRLLTTGQAATDLDQYESREREHNAQILDYLRYHPDAFDLIHDESGSFFRHADECLVPVLATLHLPRSFYPEEYFDSPSPNRYFNCVSQSQARSFADLANVVGVVQNGISTESFTFAAEKADYLLWLGRICEEKAPHLAIAAAESADLPLVIAGQVYPFRYHHDYFDREIRPHLVSGSSTRFINLPSLRQKADLIARARAVLLTSTVEETSSLVAMEAMTAGTPVIAFRREAFAEVIADGETGLLVDTVEEMAGAVARVQSISPHACRARVDRYFTAQRMAREYQSLYWQLLANAKKSAAA